MSPSEWVHSDFAIRKSKRSYAHFDFRTDLSKCSDYITSPEKVATHAFYPFIHYTIEFEKYSKDKGKKIKKREICYASHIDRCIYQYYNHLLDEMYIKRVHEIDISDSVVAYRSDLKKNNIHFSHDAFSFIKKNAPCYIMIGDFTNFFDNLDHLYLKQQLCQLLGVCQLPDDYYAVYKSVTKYCKWDLNDLLTLNHLKSHEELNKKDRVLSPYDFRKYKHAFLQKNPNAYGIPQGSPISALLANVYMLDCDKAIVDYVSALNGFYMRYSDDFCIIIPCEEKQIATDAFSHIKSILHGVKHLTLQPDKTQYFYYSGTSVENVATVFDSNSNGQNRYINFLGFTFDGTHIHIRGKTISKYYYRMGKKARSIVLQRKAGHNPSLRNLYMLYSRKGATSGRGHFLTYVNRAQCEFGVNEPIDQPVKNHMVKIRKRLNS